jgi:menaquinone-dependent protoporphyrinogen IX oxidase
MQLTNNVTIVDYFPEAFIAEADEVKGMKVVVKRFIRRVTWRSNGLKSYSTILGIEAKYDWQQRITIDGSNVTGFNLDMMPRSEYAPMAC